nr:hypothetical protein [uncultured Actinotalea sp.]
MTVLAPPARGGLTRRLVLPGWSERSRWGWDPGLECYWARLVPPPGGGAVVAVSRRHLVPTLSSLARTLAAEAGLEEGLVYVALTGGTLGTGTGTGAGPAVDARRAPQAQPT